MTKTEAAEIIANDVRVWARRNAVTITKSLVDERISELRGVNYQGSRKNTAAALANWRITLRLATATEL